jgi:hypothetical protein
MTTSKPSYLSALMTLFGRNWLTLSGGLLAAISSVIFIAFMVLGSLGILDSPYTGILTFLVLPAVFVAGLLLVPLGIYLSHRYGAGTSEQDLPFPTLDFNDPHTRRVGALVIVFTFFNLLIVGTATFAGVSFMESVPFCGEVCHTVMEPQHTAYLKSPHQRVACVECHIGPGADWFVKSKLSGLRQILAVAIHSYPSPIPSPVKDLRPSRDTCEHCHWPQKFAGDRLKVVKHYQEDEENTPLSTVLLIHIGGGEDGGKGIHSAHINSDMQVYYTSADYQRQVMSEVRVVRKGGEEAIYRAKDAKGDGGKYEERKMDCIDCHNRPSHIFKLPAEEMDEALKSGRIDASLPYIKKVGVEALAAATGKEDDNLQIEKHLRTFYEENYADLMASNREKVDTAVQQVQAIYKANVFPKMNVQWGTYPRNIGHEASPGCFRCHNDSLVSDSGKAIGQDCTNCHTVLAWDEQEPEVLQQLGI